MADAGPHEHDWWADRLELPDPGREVFDVFLGRAWASQPGDADADLVPGMGPGEGEEPAAVDPSDDLSELPQHGDHALRSSEQPSEDQLHEDPYGGGDGELPDSHWPFGVEGG
jgi:hypothetical protein